MLGAVTYKSLVHRLRYVIVIGSVYPVPYVPRVCEEMKETWRGSEHCSRSMHLQAGPSYVGCCDMLLVIHVGQQLPNPNACAQPLFRNITIQSQEIHVVNRDPSSYKSFQKGSQECIHLCSNPTMPAVKLFLSQIINDVVDDGQFPRLVMPSRDLYPWCCCALHRIGAASRAPRCDGMTTS